MSAADEQAEDTDQDPLFRGPRFDALRCALYHTERADFLARLNKIINSLVIILGASVAGKLATHLSIDSLWIELTVVVVATIQLVFDFGSSAKEHEFLQQRYYELLSEMESEPAWDKEFNKKYSTKLLLISAQETLAMRALDAVAFNKALSGLYDDEEFLEEHRLHVGYFHYIFRNIFAFNSTDFQRKPKVKAAR
jgi:hypothetical protein